MEGEVFSGAMLARNSLFSGIWQVSLRVEGEKLINVVQLVVIQRKNQVHVT